MTPIEFIRKWKPVALTERAAAQSHFNDVCALLGHDDPISADPTGEWFTFEKGVTKTGGGEGFADAWKRNHFAWEYKKKKRDLNAALDQLVRYAAALENPPLQVACDTEKFVIRTAWTNAVPETYEIRLDELVEPAKFGILRAAFFDPEKLRPKLTRAGLTKEAADKFSTIALRLQGAGTPEEVAHFVNQLVFCFFANSARLLPEGFFPKLLKRAAQKPEKAQSYFNQLFAAMETGGEFDLTDIAWFNGGLFDGSRALKLDSGDIGLLQAAATLDWSQIDPTIFGTLFERFLDPQKRKQIGAHYTDSEKIMMIVEPVILRPLREEWAAARAAQAIAKAAKRLDELRTAWLNPPDLVRIEPEVTPTAAPGEEPVRYPDRILPRDAAAAAKLKERTLTKLYNQRPQWLADAHRDLDAAVAAAYGWPADISEEDALARLLDLNLERSARQDKAPALSPRRERVAVEQPGEGDCHNFAGHAVVA